MYFFTKLIRKEKVCDFFCENFLGLILLSIYAFSPKGHRTDEKKACHIALLCNEL